jgi:hypothetical protein
MDRRAMIFFMRFAATHENLFLVVPYRPSSLSPTSAPTFRVSRLASDTMATSRVALLPPV